MTHYMAWPQSSLLYYEYDQYTMNICHITYPLAFLPWEDHASKLIWPPDCDQCTRAILTLQPALTSESPPVLLLLHL